MPSPARTQAGRTARGRPRAGRIKRASCEASDEKLEKTWSAVGTLYLRRGGFNHKDVEADLKVRLYEDQMKGVVRRRTDIVLTRFASLRGRDGPSFTFSWDTFVHDALRIAPSSVSRRSSKSAR